MGKMLSLQKVTKIYHGAENIKAVNDLSFDLEEGEICTVVGPSGCGKTTAMKMINRLVPVSSGEIFINGENIARLDTIELRRSIGYVIQNIGLFPNMTIGENIAIIPKLLKWDRDLIEERVCNLLETVNLPASQYKNRYPRELSGGQQQRVGVARAMAGDPPIMLMDEPFGAIDPINREHLQNEFLKIQEKMRKTVVFVTHDIDEAIKMGDKICLLKDGCLVQFDSPEEMLTNPKNEFVSSFVGGDRTLKRLNLFTVKKAMREDTPLVDLNQTVESAVNMAEALNINFLIAVDEDHVFKGIFGINGTEPGLRYVYEAIDSPRSFLPTNASLKDALSEIFTHDYGFLVVVDDDRRVIGWLQGEDIKRTLKG